MANQKYHTQKNRMNVLAEKHFREKTFISDVQNEVIKKNSVNKKNIEKPNV